MFCASQNTGVLTAYKISNSTTSEITLDNPKTVHLCSDWDGVSSQFNLYISTTTTTIYKIPFNNGFMYDVEANLIVTNTSVTGIPTYSRMFYRFSHNHKYLYFTRSTNITEVDVTNFSSCTSRTIGNFPFQILSAVNDSANNTIYLNLNGSTNTDYDILKVDAYTIDNTNGQMTIPIGETYTGTTIILESNASTSISSGNFASAQGQYVRRGPIGSNFNSVGMNIYTTTEDNKLVKLYPDGGSGVGGDPHIRPLIGDLYTLDNYVKKVKLLEHKKIDDIKIIGDTWMLPECELEKFKHKPKIYKTMSEYTYLKTIAIDANGTLCEMDLDSLNITNNFVTNDIIKVGDITKVCSLMSIRKKIILTNLKSRCETIQRIVEIKGKENQIILVITSNVGTSDRNNISITINSAYEINTNNYKGALVKEEKDNNIDFFSLHV